MSLPIMVPLLIKSADSMASSKTGMIIVVTTFMQINVELHFEF